MISAPIPANEKERIEALYDYSILDTSHEEQFDNITKLASQICQTSSAHITLVDSNRVWYKSNFGIEMTEVPRESGFCPHNLIPDELLIVPDMNTDSRFVDHPMVIGNPGIVFYAGAPLVNPDGLALGSICVTDIKKRDLSEFQIEALNTLSIQVMQLFELHKTKDLLTSQANELKSRNEALERFASTAAHDIKSPLNNIDALIDLILRQHKSDLPKDVVEMMSLIAGSSNKLARLIRGILDLSKNSSILQKQKEIINLDDFIKEIFNLLDSTKKIEYTFPKGHNLFANRVALQQIFINLIGNAINHNDKESLVIDITFFESTHEFNFSIIDNGPGIRNEDQERIFNLFDQTKNKNGIEQQGHGIGLATVKRLVEGMSGKLSVKSELGNGASFSFSISK